MVGGYRLLKIETVGSKQDVRVFYYDTETYRLYTKMDKWPHIIFSREVVPEKHKFSTASILEELLKKNPDGHFEIKPYNVHRNGNGDDVNIFTGGQESFTVWHLGDRDAGKTLEFFLKKDPDKPYIPDNYDRTKQIFFRNSGKFIVKTKALRDARDLEDYKRKILQKAASDPAYSSIREEDIRINSSKAGNNYLELRCNEDILERIPSEVFRINTYESRRFSKIKDAEELFKTIRNSLRFGKEYSEEWHDTYYDDLFPEIVSTKVGTKKISNLTYVDGLVDHLRIYPGRDDAKEYFTVRIDAADVAGVQRVLEKAKLRKRNIRDARKEVWDPLELDNPTKQLRHFFPLHMPYDPDKPLVEQPCTEVHPFHKSTDGWDLETALNDAKEFTIRNMVALDIEVIDYTKEPVSGRIFMSTLDSQKEKAIYMTREAWHQEDFKTAIAEMFPGITLRFTEDEVQLIARFSEDAQKYVYVFGYNNKKYDQAHLTKFNDEAQLLKQGKITQEQYEAIRIARRSYKTTDDKTPKALWIPNMKTVCDPLKYFIYRNRLFGNNKLATIMGFKKPLTYDEITEKTKSGTLEGLTEVTQYQAEDGEETKALALRIVPNALLEVLAANKPINSVFDSEPVKNFYDSGQRRYLMVKHTHRDRHDMSFRRHLAKLEDRLSPEEIFLEAIRDMPQTPRFVEGGLYYASPLLETFKPVIMRDPVLTYMYSRMLNEKDLLLKLDLIWKLSSSMLVAIDKSKNFMHAAGKEFGVSCTPQQIYATLDGEGDIVERFYEELGERKTTDFELSRTSWIFSLEYGAVSDKINNGSLPYYLTILNLNNEFAEKLAGFKKAGFDARSGNFVVSTKPQDMSYGYYLGDVRAINLRNNRMIARFIKTMDDRTYSDVYQGIERLTHPKIAPLVEDALAGKLNISNALTIGRSLSVDDREIPAFRDIFKALTGKDLINRRLKKQLVNPQETLL